MQLPNLIKLFLHVPDFVQQQNYICLDPPSNAKWMVRGAILQPQNGFKHHPLPLEGAGVYTVLYSSTL